MIPVITKLTKSEARMVEQMLITAYTLEALENARREIAKGNTGKFAEESKRAVEIMSSPGINWLDFIRG